MSTKLSEGPSNLFNGVALWDFVTRMSSSPPRKSDDSAGPTGSTTAAEVHQYHRRDIERASVRSFPTPPDRVLGASESDSIPLDDIVQDPSIASAKKRGGASTENRESAAPLVQELTPEQRRKSLIHFLGICWSIWLLGWSDGTTGPLLPRIQENYQVGFSIVSLIFVGNCLGYITGAAMNIWLNDRYGFGKVMVLGAAAQLVSYGVVLAVPPFSVLICAYAITGFGLALQAAQGNGFVGSLQRDMSTKLGIMHAAYGLGAFTSPFSATYFSTLTSRRWILHFAISAGLSLINLCVLVYIFKFKTQEELLLEAGQETHHDAASQNQSKYRQVFGTGIVYLLAIFSIIYVGVEVTLGGWIVTFIIHKRHGGPDSGYISSGFWGGLTLGRVGLMWLNKRVGEKKVIFIYSAIAIGLEITIWFVPSIIGNAVAISLVGVVLGPMFPLLVSHMTHILPRWLLTGSVGIVAGVGVAGAAALPFVTGMLASKFGVGSLQPLMIAMMVLMVIVWALVPNASRRTD